MGRNPKVRDDYRGDAITVHRILKAIQADESCSPEWKAAAKAEGEKFFRLLMQDHKIAPLPEIIRKAS